MAGKVLGLAAKELYELDVFEWTVRNAELLRAGRYEEADILHIAEELEDMGKRDRRELLSRVRLLVAHLLKWQFQPDRRSPSWEETIDPQRTEIGDLLQDMPSLRRALASHLRELYPQAVRRAARETGLSRSAFPDRCPYTPEQILDIEFLPK
jgi:hypothetical protein